MSSRKNNRAWTCALVEPVRERMIAFKKLQSEPGQGSLVSRHSSYLPKSSRKVVSNTLGLGLGSDAGDWVQMQGLPGWRNILHLSVDSPYVDGLPCMVQ